jgi:conjugative transfer signal peptidase TraF
MPKLKSFTALVIGLSVSAMVAVPALYFDRPVVIYNATDSLPHGWYLVVSKPVYERGELVVFPVPAVVTRLVQQRHWLPAGAFLMKPVAGKSGDLLDTKHGRCLVNGIDFGALDIIDRKGLPLPVFSASQRLKNGEVAVVSHTCCSFDSRYFGPIMERDIVGAARPIWTWERTTRRPQLVRPASRPQSMGMVRDGVGMGSAR